MNWIFNKVFGFFIGRFFGRLEKRFERETKGFAAAKSALEAGQTAPIEREWKRVAAREHGRDMVADNHELQVALLWGNHLMSQNQWALAQGVFERGLGATKGLATQRFELFFRLADALFLQTKTGEVKELLRDHPLTKQIEAISRAWPGSDTGARLAQVRFDFAEEARLRRKVFAPSPLVPGEMGDILRAQTGDDGERWRKVAMAHYFAGEISLAIEVQEKVLECSKNRLHRVSALGLSALWRRLRDGWDAVEPLLSEAETLAQGDAKAETMTIRKRRFRAQESADWKEWRAQGEELRLRGASDQSLENDEFFTAILLGDWQTARTSLEGKRVAPRPIKPHEAFRISSFPALERAILELGAHDDGLVVDLPDCEREVREAQERLNGDRRLSVSAKGALATLIAAQNRVDEALQLARALEEEWPTWSDCISTQADLCSYLGTVYLQLERFPKAIEWFERRAQIEKRPAYSAVNTEFLARACHSGGDTERAQILWREVAASGLELRAVELARRALDA